jgi:diguanylate cyclase (GGDEF)-like protein
MKSILLISDDPSRLAQWQEWLDDARLSIRSASSLESAHFSSIDCIVTDRNLVAELPPTGLEGIGLIVVGTSGFGDVQLAQNNRSELRLACRLLAEISQLRRQKKRQARMAKVYERMAFVDPLTQLANRRGWDQYAENNRLPANAVLAFFDLDAFKQINEEFGYERGDETIRVAGLALRSALPEDAFLARWGGDEFVAVFSDQSPHEHMATIRDTWLQSMLRQGVTVSGTIGWSPFPADESSSVKAQFVLAEQALREAKATNTPLLGSTSIRPKE